MITEDILLLYYYDELTPGEREQVRIALANDPRLAVQYRGLCNQLEKWRNESVPPAADHLRQRWHDSIDRAARSAPARAEARRAGPRLWLAGMGAALAAALAIGIGIGVRLQDQQILENVVNSSTGGTETVPAGTVPLSFTRGLQLHLNDSQREIRSLSIGDDASRIALTLQLIEQNRLFAQAAAQRNAPNLARVLRAFEPILLRLASDDIAPQDAEALRDQLAFELKVMLTKLASTPSEEPETI
jgi:hypothetical protein